MKSLIRTVENHLGHSFIRLAHRVKPRSDLKKLGSDYGGWVVPTDLIEEGAICYCAGVGEDASFDLALIERFGCEVHAFDPTPQAIAYSRRIQESEPRFVFHPYGLWSEDTVLRFYAPRDPNHVSHSALNLQKTESYFEAEVRSLLSITRELEHRRIDLLKMDIEGAEHTVLDSMRTAGLWPTVLCVEFDRPCPLSRIHSQIQNLGQDGYEVVAVDGWNFTFARELIQ